MSTDLERHIRHLAAQVEREQEPVSVEEVWLRRGGDQRGSWVGPVPHTPRLVPWRRTGVVVVAAIIAGFLAVALALLLTGDEPVPLPDTTPPLPGASVEFDFDSVPDELAWRGEEPWTLFAIGAEALVEHLSEPYDEVQSSQRAIDVIQWLRSLDLSTYCADPDAFNPIRLDLRSWSSLAHKWVGAPRGGTFKERLWEMPDTPQVLHCPVRSRNRSE